MAHSGPWLTNAQDDSAATQDNFLTADIFEYLGLTGLTPVQKTQLLATMLETIQTRVVGRLLDIFKDDAERGQLENALEEKDTDTINTLLSSRGLKNIQELIAEEVVLYKLEVMNLFRETA